MILLLSIYFLFAIKDPNLKKLHQKLDMKLDKNGKPKSKTVILKEKIERFTRLVKEELLSKPILVTTMIGSSITRLIAVLFSTYLILWI